MCKRNYKNEHAINHNTFMYFHLCPPACGVCVCDGGAYSGNNCECALPTLVLTESDFIVTSLHGSEQTPTNPKHNMSVIA